MPIPLVERSESYVARRIRRRVRSLDDVADCAEVSIGYTRKKPSIHLEVILEGNPTYEKTHGICSTIEGVVRHVVPNSHVEINSQSSGIDDAGSIWKVAKEIAETEPGSRGAQSIHLNKVDGGLGVDFLLVANARATGRHLGRTKVDVEKKLKGAEARVQEVVIHSEALPELILSERSGSGTELRWLVEHIVGRFPELKLLRPPAVQRLGDQASVSVRVAFTGSDAEEKAEESIANLEGAIKSAYPAITNIDIVESGAGRGFNVGGEASNPT
jgi:hypothetical protein